MNHLPRDAEILATQLAAARGISRDQAVVAALRETLERTAAKAEDPKPPDDDDLIPRLEELSRRAGALQVLDDRSSDDILGYDPFGLPG